MLHSIKEHKKGNTFANVRYYSFLCSDTSINKLLILINMKTNANIDELKTAIESVNNKYGYKITFKRLDKTGKWVNFTIRSEKSGIPGSCCSDIGTKTINASWHAHGYLFDELLAINPDCTIVTSFSKIDKNGGNWHDIILRHNGIYVRASNKSIL